MGTSDGSVLGMTKVVDHGDPALRWNLVILGDGYQAAQIGQFHTDAQSFLDTMKVTEPFGELWSGVNAYRIDVTSTDSGADDPLACGGTGDAQRTFFDASFCNNGIRRLLEVNDATVHAVVNARLPQAHMIMVIVNSTVYGGSGGNVATFSLAGGANEIALHEMGHTAFGFADEYESYAGCGVDPPGTHDAYVGPEPAQPNITASADRTTNKWHDLVAVATPMPTTTNANPAECDPQPNPLTADTVGAYEGAGYFHSKLYRAQFDCRMRSLGHPFCAACRRVIRRTLVPHLSAVKIGGNTTASSPCAAGDWVYFRGTDDRLWKINADGTGRVNIGGNKTSAAPFVAGDRVYFRGTDDKLWKINADGTAQANVGGNKTSSAPFVSAGVIYFRGTDDKLWKINADGTGKANVGNNKTLATPFVSGDWIYFRGTDDKLWKIKTDGTGKVNLGGNKTSSAPFVFGSWVYFRGPDNSLQRIGADGTAQSSVGGNATASTPFATADSVYFQGTDNALLRAFVTP